KPVVVTNIGSFREFPDGIVYKSGIGNNEVKDLVNLILKTRLDDDTISKEILEYTKENHSMAVSRRSYTQFMSEVISGEKVNLYLGLSETIARYIKTINKETVLEENSLMMEKNIDELTHLF